MPDSNDLPAVPAPGPEGPAAVPEGVETLPQWGEAAIGARFKEGALTFYRILSVVLAVLAVATLALGFAAFADSLAAVAIALVLAVLLAVSAVNYHRIAAHGPVRPAVVVTATTLEVLVPFNRFSADLAAIRDVTVLSRDLIVLAPGGIRNGERSSRARRAVINNVRSFEVERKALAAVILEHARAARGQG